MAAGQRKRDFLGHLLYGTGLRILVVNDQIGPAMSIFRNVINDAHNEGVSNIRDALAKVRKAARSGKPYNVVFVDKNLGDPSGVAPDSQKLIEQIIKISPKSHICIHSGETGPGKFSHLPFISIMDLDRLDANIRKYIATVERQPFRATKQRIDLSVLARPNAVLTNWGVVKVFHAVEGSPLPEEAKRLIAEGGRVLSIPEAIERIGSISSMADRAAIYREQERAGQIGKKPRRPRRQMGR